MTESTLTASGTPRPPVLPFRAWLLAGSVPLFAGVLLSDIAYAGTAQVQWKNFASWLNAGALLLGGLALLGSVIGLIGAGRERRGSLLASTLLLAGWALGFANSLVHAKDAGATLPEGLVLAALVLVLVVAASVSELITARLGLRT